MIALCLLVLGAGPPVDRNPFLPQGAIARLGTGEYRSSIPRSDVALSHSGRWAAVLGDTLHVGDGRGGVRSMLINERSGPGWDRLAISPDGRWVVGHPGRVLLYDVREGVPAAILHEATNGRESTVAFSADSQFVVIGANTTRGPNIAIRAMGGRRTVFLPGLRTHFAATLSPDGKLVATWRPATEGGKGDLAIQNVRTGKATHELEVARGITHAAFSPSGGHIAVVHEARAGFRLSLLSWKGGKARHGIDLRDIGAGPCFSIDGGRVAIAERSGAIRILDAATGKGQHFPPSGEASLTALAFLADGRLMAAGWAGDRPVTWTVRRHDAPAADKGPITALAFSHDGRRLLTGGLDGGRVWVIATGQELRRLPHPGNGKAGAFLAFTPGGRYMLAGWQDGPSLRLLDTRDGEGVDRLFPEEGEARFLPMAAFTHDGKRVLAAAPNDRGVTRLSLWTVKGLHKGRSVDIAQPVGRLAPSPDGTLAAIAYPYSLVKGFRRGGSGVAIFRLENGEKLADLPAAPNTPLAWSPSGRTLAFTREGRTALIEPANGGSRLLDGKAGVVSAMAFSPCGRLLAVASHDAGRANGRIALHEMATGTVRMTLEGAGPVGTLAFSPDGGWLASAGDAGSALVWDLSGREWARRAGPADWKTLDSEDASVAWKSMTGLVCMPNATVRQMRGRLKPVPGRGMSPAEFRRHLTGLGDDEFETRQRSGDALAAVAVRNRERLVKALEESEDLEVRKRLEEILKRERQPGPVMLREMRAVEVLERIGTREARLLLEDIAWGNPDARLTMEAEAALSRMERR